MLQVMNERNFVQAFHDHDRGNQFTPEALGYIFDYLEQMAEDSGLPYELDVIALCCAISESTPDEIKRDYCMDADADVLQELDDRTRIIGETPDGNIVFFQF